MYVSFYGYMKALKVERDWVSPTISRTYNMCMYKLLSHILVPVNKEIKYRLEFKMSWVQVMIEFS